MIRRAWTVARRELRSYFDHATAYILLVVFLAVNFFFFFRDAYLLGEASLRPMFGLLPWLLLFFVPAVAMRSIAEERRSGTLELVLAQPISEVEFLVGKYLGVLGLLTIALGATLGAPIGLSLGADLAWGIVVAQYAGALLLVAGLAAVGVWASSLTRNQVTAFIVGVSTIFVLYLLGLPAVLLGLPPALATVAGRLGVLGHFETIAQGVLDVRDGLYFVALSGAFLALAHFSLLRDRLSRRRAGYRRLVAGTGGVVGIAVLAGLLGGELRARIDLTPGRSYTLSPVTRRMLGELDDVVTVKLFLSRELPPEFRSVKRDVEDLLRDFDTYGGGNVVVIRRFPARDPEAESEATTLGIPPIEFNILGEEEFRVRQGYLGIAVQYAGSTETIPVIQRTADLEYRLASAIRTLTREKAPVLAFLDGHGEEDLAESLRAAGARLHDEYAVERLRFDSLTTRVPDSVAVLVVAGPRDPLPPKDAEALRAFSKAGGHLLLLASTADVDQLRRFAMPAPKPWLDTLLADYGISVLPGLAYDLRTNARLPIRGQAGVTYLVPYPLWPLARPASEHITVRDLSAVLLPWPSPLDLSGADSTQVTPLLATSDFGGRLPGPTSVDPTRDWSLLEETDPGAQVVAAAALSESGGRAIVVGSSFVSSNFLEASPDNVRFLQNAIDWLAQDEALIRIRSKDRTPPRLLFPSNLARDAAKYGNLIGIPVLLVLFGMVRLAGRRRRQKQTYRGESAA